MCRATPGAGGSAKEPALPRLSAEDLQFDEIIRHTRARAEFKPVANFRAEGVEGIGGTKPIAAALRVGATGHEPAVFAVLNCGGEFHAPGNLLRDARGVNGRKPQAGESSTWAPGQPALSASSFGVHAVDDANDD